MAKKEKILYTAYSMFSAYELAKQIEFMVNEDGWELFQPILVADADDGINGPFYTAFLRSVPSSSK